MTAWQDQPPQGNKPLSRRQVRQNERGDVAEVGFASGGLPVGQSDFSSFAREGWDTEARRIAAAQQLQPQVQQPASRRSQRSLQAVDPLSDPGAEPLSYLTQARPQVQNPEGQQLRRRSVQAVGAESFDRQSEQRGYRVRDFSPEGRPSFSSTTPEVVDPTILPENLQYRTHGTPPSYVAPVRLPDHSVVEERTFSRRELRAMEAAQQIPEDLYPAAPAPQTDPFAQLFGSQALVEPAPVERPSRRDRSRASATEKHYGRD